MTRREDLLVPADKLRWRCDPGVFGAESTAEIDNDAMMIGQARALEALRLGIEIRSPGYNVFVSGLSGTGRSSAVHRLLVGLESKCVDVPDKAFVHGFDEPTRPRLLQLTRGRARPFAEALDRFSRNLATDLPALFESPAFIAQRRKIEESVSENQRDRFAAFSEECRLGGLALIQVQVGQATRPGLGIPVGEEVFPIESLSNLVSGGKLKAERAEILKKNASVLRDKLDRELIEGRQVLRQLQEALEDYDKNQARETFVAELAEMRAAFPDEDAVQFLDEVENEVLENLHVFQGPEDESRDAFLGTLEVSVVLDNSDRDDTPVLVESNPTYANVFGTIERRVHASGEVYTDHTKVRAGALVAADGGYLILTAEDVLSEPGVWATLKRVLKTGQLEIQPKESALGAMPILFKPQPIPLQVKVVLIGDGHLYAQLQAYDPDFRKTFKIRADFDSVMDRDDENVLRYGAFLSRLAAAEDMLPFDKTAMAAIAEFGARLCDHGGKISTQFSQVADVAREAHHFAQADGAARVSAPHVASSLRAAEHRENLYDRKLAERIIEGTVLLPTDGAQVGVVNGLTVFSSGRFSFGKPARITATVSAGDAGVLNVEREVQLSGEIHDKGVLILSSYFRERFGQRHPLSFSASLCFEQNYAGVDGDSASSTELYALVSALSGVPLDQGIGITGSVNQKGEIQPIGGVNEKIEGFFDVCRSRGLTGRQGVIIPIQNVDDLMLDDEVVAAVKDGKFHVWAVSHVDQGMEILTGMAAGSAADLESREPGAEVPDSLHRRVAERLMDLAEIARDFKGAGGDDDKPVGNEDEKGSDPDGEETASDDARRSSAGRRR